jgi:uncharacterized protein YukE
MTTIHMDIEQVKAVLNLMQKDGTDIRSILSALNAVVNSTKSDWKATAADEFFKEYEDLNAQLVKRLDATELLSIQLQQEIAEWEVMAAKLG